MTRALMPLAVMVSMLAALPLLGGLIRGDWWGPAAVLVVAVAVVSALYRLTDRNAFPVPFLQLIVAALLFTPILAPGTGFLGVVPTAATFEQTWALFEQGVHSINTSAPPVAATNGLRMIIALTFVVFALTADFLAVTARCPGMVGGLLLALMLVPLAVDGGGLTWVQAAVCAAGFLALLATDMWVRGREWGVPVPGGHDPVGRFSAGAVQVGTVVAAAATAILLALSLPLMMPSLRTDAFYTMADGNQFASNNSVTTTHPLVSLRRDLASSSDRTVLTYRTDSEDPEYLRTFVLDEFDGENWTMSPVHTDRDARVSGDLPLPPGWAEESDTSVTTRVSLDSGAPRMEFLPLPYPARTVEVSGDWYVDPDTLMVFTTDTPSTGFNFVVESAENQPDAQDLADAGPPRSLPNDYLRLPNNIDDRVQELTDSLTANADSPYARATALQDFFTGGAFTYDLSPPATPGDADPLSHFLLDDRIGYCEQFAGAMALMARQADIPARVAVGYTAGQQVGDGRWSVAVSDAHAWPELYFEGSGWVRFEPTPASSQGQGSATVPDYTSGADADPEPVPEPEPTNASSPEPSESPTEEPSASPEAGESPEDEPAEEVGGTADGNTGSDAASWWPAAVGVVAALLLLAAPALTRALIRGSRRATLASAGVAGAHTAWRELRDTCLDLGLDWVLTESPRATAARLCAIREDGSVIPGEAHAAIWRLARAEEAARYAPDPQTGTQLAADLATATTGLSASASGSDRWRALLLPRSLAPWQRPRTAAEAVPATS
ncbi:transglutaminase-like putative cysteine protease [Nocardiopsis metallicus]|uniref:Transglutaminase-like putative cysteine protease n=2 Tax=Nocardiopsis metallicus TaxID=179819 RepID=A0A840WB21_9ACTN|nr:transglutaminase-like putative cysteine protease [Nocardiopsis metallicus]